MTIHTAISGKPASSVRAVMLLGALCCVSLLAGCASWLMPSMEEARQQLAAKAEAAGARDVKVKIREDFGLNLVGTLEGRDFALDFPRKWDGQEALLFAHGYSPPGMSIKVAEDPVEKDPALGLLRYAFLQGLAVGHSAYDKAGYGVQSGAENTYRLKQFLDRLGARRTYVAGGSMGGNIVVSLVEDHPDAFAGAVAACGVDSSFREELGHAIDLRAVYDYYTAGTPYRLPGSRELDRSALAAETPWALGFLQYPLTVLQYKRLTDPIVALFRAAQKDPDGKEAQIIAKVASITGWDAEPASFISPLTTIGLGMDDFRAVAGGNFYDNTLKVYGSPLLKPDEAAALNRDVARIKGDEQAIAYVDRWHTASGQITTPVVTLHNQIDPLVPYSQAVDFGSWVAQAGKQAQLVQITVPAEKLPVLLGGGLVGYVHCGFTGQQLTAAWDELHQWVRTGVRPQGQ